MAKLNVPPSAHRLSFNRTTAQAVKETTVVQEHSLPEPLSPPPDIERHRTPAAEDDVFGNEEGAEIQYKTCSWWYVFELFLTHTKPQVTRLFEVSKHGLTCYPSFHILLT